MNTNNKISPAFEPFLAKSGSNDVREAVVIYHAPKSDNIRIRGRLRKLKKRLDSIKERATIQQDIEMKLFKSYQRDGRKSIPGKIRLEVSSIGSGTLPVATVEITRKTLNSLAKQPNVVAILPNQRIQLIQPKEVQYSKLASQEKKDGITWGLKQLDIPKLWKTTKGEEITCSRSRYWRI